MALFGKPIPVQLTPRIALAAAMLYVAAADGKVDPNERHDIWKVVPDDNVLDAATDYVKVVTFAQFAQQAAQLLTPPQKMSLLLNVADMAMGDGNLAPQESEMLMHLAQAFQIPEQHLQPHIQALQWKNNLAVFG